MKEPNLKAKYILAVILLTVFLTTFFYIHETLPKPLRAITALLGTPVAIASGLSYYLHLNIEVYESPFAVVLINLIAALIIVWIAGKCMKMVNKKT